MMKSFKIMFFLTMTAGTLITISSNSWMSMWLGLEINLLSIIPLLKANWQTNSAEASIKYFIVQVMASNILLMAIILTFNYNSQMNLAPSTILIIQSALMTKIGAAPFHMWLPEVLEGLSWMNCLIMLTWQKIAPMIILMNTNKQSTFISMITVLSITIGSIMGFNQTSLRKIMAFSSINHMGWMLAAMMSMKSLWVIYFSIYSLISINVILIFKNLKIKTVTQIPTFFKNSKMINLLFSMNFLSLGGLPPFLGFLPKWLTIQQLTMDKNFAMSVILIMMTLIATFFYLRLSLIPLALMNSSNNNKINPKIKFLIISLNTISLAGLMGCSFIPFF
uniref:NADH dehydrogenase subunit 2 n=1 Tax=Adiscus speciosus TaxID=2978449 RepID=UPI0021CCD1DA|nr:NADH dehydrogenase subunit 2 [Adiscus speciosus]UWV18184.1 NADH dehydrogenase subunit 2 [Adiscus speciosus]